jgi:hypothetical protein
MLLNGAQVKIGRRDAQLLIDLKTVIGPCFVDGARVTLCPRARPTSKRQRPEPTDPTSRSPQRNVRAIPFRRSDHASSASGFPISQPYSTSNSQ